MFQLLRPTAVEGNRCIIVVHDVKRREFEMILFRFWMVSLALLAGAGGVNGQEPLVHMRADSLLDVRADGRVTAWKSVTGDARFVPDTTYVRPLFIASAINGRPAIRFANDG